jgi:hypothetical protein
LQWMKNDLTTRAWQHDIGCPISIVLLSISDDDRCHKQDAYILLELAFSGEQVLVEQDRWRADGK